MGQFVTERAGQTLTSKICGTVVCANLRDAFLFYILQFLFCFTFSQFNCSIGSAVC